MDRYIELHVAVWLVLRYFPMWFYRKYDLKSTPYEHTRIGDC